jgi:hypothetical protein
MSTSAGEVLTILAVCFWFSLQVFTAYNAFAANQRAKNIEKFLELMPKNAEAVDKAENPVTFRS